MRTRPPWLAGLCLACALAPGAGAQAIRLEGDPWPPYLAEPGARNKGFMVDVAEAAFKAQGQAITLQVVPWTRALQDLEAGRADGVVGIYAGQAREKGMLLPAEEIGLSVNKLFVKADSTWVYSGIPSLGGRVLGTIAGYEYGELDSYIADQLARNTGKVDEMHGDGALQANLNKLLLDRVTVIVEDAIVVNFATRELGLAGKVKAAGSVEPKNKVYIAFSGRNPKSASYAKALSEGIVKLRRSGELKAILDRYGVADWKK